VSVKVVDNYYILYLLEEEAHTNRALIDISESQGERRLEREHLLAGC